MREGINIRSNERPQEPQTVSTRPPPSSSPCPRRCARSAPRDRETHALDVPRERVRAPCDRRHCRHRVLRFRRPAHRRARHRARHERRQRHESSRACVRQNHVHARHRDVRRARERPRDARCCRLAPAPPVAAAVYALFNTGLSRTRTCTPPRADPLASRDVLPANRREERLCDGLPADSSSHRPQRPDSRPV